MVEECESASLVEDANFNINGTVISSSITYNIINPQLNSWYP